MLETRGPELGVQGRTEVLLNQAKAMLTLGRATQAEAKVDSARALIESHGLDRMQDYLGIFQGIRQWADGGSLGVMRGVELFRRSLLSAFEAGA